jgi:hypothetical protein
MNQSRMLAYRPTEDEISGFEIGAGFPVMPSYGRPMMAGPRYGGGPSGFAAPLPMGAQMVAQGPAGVQAFHTAPGSIKRYLTPVSGTFFSIAAASSNPFSINAQRAFRVERLIFQTDETGGSIASLLQVQEINVGATPQFTASGVIPLSAFAPQTVFSAIRGDTALPGKTITIIILNGTAAAVKVMGGLVGESLDV